MSMRLAWAPDVPAYAVTTYNIEKSINKGINWTALVTITYVLSNPAVYDKVSKQFYYDDGVGNPGDLYRIRANGAYGTSAWKIMVAPMLDPPMCNIIGYVRLAMGGVDTAMPIRVSSFGAKDKRWSLNPVNSGIVSHNPEALGLVEWATTVYPDATGLWQIDLVQGLAAKVQIDAMNYVLAFEVPSVAGPVNIRDIREYRGASFEGIYDEQGGEPKIIIPS